MTLYFEGASTVRPFAAATGMTYERLVASDEFQYSSSGFDAVVADQENARKRMIVREKLERIVWILTSVAIVWFGDGSTDLVNLAVVRAKAQRCGSEIHRAVKSCS